MPRCGGTVVVLGPRSAVTAPTLRGRVRTNWFGRWRRLVTLCTQVLEMMPATLRETPLDPEKRRLLQVSIPDTERLVTETTISELMGKDSSARFRFIMEHAAEVDELDV